jgi:drug/metabolite transporter (DMT)-like permease
LSISPALAAAIAVGGNLILSLGMTLQKGHIGWIGSPRSREGFGRDLGLWLVGIILMNIVFLFNFVALMGLSTNVVGAITGTSVAFTAILSHFMLKERLGRRRMAWTIALFAAIAAAGLLGEKGSSAAEGLSPLWLYAFLALPLAAGGLLWALRTKLKGSRLAAGIAATSGALGGFMIFPMRAVQVSADPSLLGLIASPYLYAYLVAGATSFVLIQIAYKDGEMSTVAPALYGMQVLWPAIGSLFVFGAEFRPVQAAAFALVAFCVAAISGARPRAAISGARPRAAISGARSPFDLPKNELPKPGDRG